MGNLKTNKKEATEAICKLLILLLVGTRGFEPPAP
jgi:hypothetical protein